MRKTLLFILTLVSTQFFAQEYLMQNGSVNTCSGTFYDTGGADNEYQSGEDYTFTICPDGGDAVQVDFTFFDVESATWDNLTVYDGDSTSAQQMGVYGGSTSPGLVQASYENETGCLTFVFHSDSSVTYDGWEATISCFTPVYIPPFPMEEGTFNTCEGMLYDSGGQYENYQNSESITMTLCPDNDIQRMSVDFTSFNVENNWDFLHIYDGADSSAPLIGTYTGTTSPGYIEAGNDNESRCLTFVFESDNSVNRPGFSASISCVTPTLPGNPTYGTCSVLEVSDDTEVGCYGGPCTEISANLGFDLIGGGADTSSYTISNVNCPLEIEPGTPVSVNIDDRWSSVIDMTFDFSFFGNTYNQLLIGSNGLITFDLTEVDGYCPWSFSDTAPSSNLPINAIFGAYHDIDPSVCGEISYYVTGTAPYRAFVVNFMDVCHFSCNSLQTTQHIILYETSNIVEVYIDDKPTCNGWNGGRALIGIQNEGGTIAYVPEGRNTGNWSASNEQWRFIPDDTIDIDYEFEWLDEDNNVISNELSTIVCPDEETTYTANLTYSIYGVDYDLSESVTVSIGPTETVEANEPDDMENCEDVFLQAAEFDLTTVEDQVLNGQTNATLSYYTNANDAYDGTNAISNPESVYVNDQYTIWVRVDDDQTDCFAVTNFDLFTYENGSYPTGIPDDLVMCSDEVDGYMANFDLTIQDEYVQDGDTGGVTYYLSMEDAETASNAIDSPFVNTENPQMVYARLESDLGCYGITSFNLVVNAMPQAGEATYPDEPEVCNEGFGIGTFDLSLLTDQVMGTYTSDYDVTYYSTQSDAESMANAIADITSYQSESGNVYATLTSPEGCSSMVSIPLLVTNCIPTMPNAFSPNNDGTNDVYSIEGLNNVYPDFNLGIYNRWGKLIYEAKNNDPFWDGSIDGVISSDPEAATYFYILELNDGEHEPLKGWIYVNP
jgi:gliding motility-associated-like protein